MAKHIIQKNVFFFVLTPIVELAMKSRYVLPLVERSFFEFKRQKNLNKNSMKKKTADDKKGARCTQARKTLIKTVERRIEQIRLPHFPFVANTNDSKRDRNPQR